jgi:iron complex outermembrane receptor protein
LAFTRLDATFEDSGSILPGVPRTQAYASLRYRRDSYYAQLEAARRSRVAVNDANAQFADAYTVAGVVAGLVQRGARWRVTEFVRIDNIADRDYAGSVIVNEGNSRFYEPAPGRSYLVGVQASLQF